MTSVLSFRIISIRKNHHLRDNKQPYNHAVKLPDGHSGLIRLLCYSEISGSVPRSGSKRSTVFCCCAPGHGAGEKHNIW
ncbi:hypothetical protein CD006_26465 [Enterobacter sp. 10-1]|nr:hypothetical protein CD006_26465 [Enterobacter sp. 10-1]